jgi:hypothetical protein
VGNLNTPVLVPIGQVLGDFVWNVIGVDVTVDHRQVQTIVGPDSLASGFFG